MTRNEMIKLMAVEIFDNYNGMSKEDVLAMAGYDSRGVYDDLEEHEKDAYLFMARKVLEMQESFNIIKPSHLVEVELDPIEIDGELLASYTAFEIDGWENET